jgi:phosphonate transport system permease protein
LAKIIADKTMKSFCEVPAQVKKQRRFYNIMLGIIIVLFLVSTIHTQYNPFEIFLNLENFVLFIRNDMLPPNFERAIGWGLWPQLAQTVSMGFLASLIGGIISFALCFLASFATSPHPFFVKFVRGLASVERNVPSAIWLFFFRMTFGIGITIGFIALLINTIGFLIRMFADVVDEVGRESMEAIDSTGAGYLPKLFQCVIPAAKPGFVSWLLFSIEINIRAAGVVGALGGGGIGMLLNGYISLFMYRAAFAVILVLAATTIIVSIVADYLRKKVLTVS